MNRFNRAFLALSLFACLFGLPYSSVTAQESEVATRPVATTPLRGDESFGVYQDGQQRRARISDVKSTSVFYATGYSTLDAAITSIGSAVGTLVINQPISAVLDVTVPATLGVRFEGAGVLTVPNTKTVTFNGAFEAPTQRIFTLTGTGVVKFGYASTPWLLPEWWGAIPDASTNSTTALRACLIAAGDLYRAGWGAGFAAHVKLSSGIYIISGAIPISSNVLIAGQSRGGTSFQSNSGDYNLFEMLGGSYAGGFVFDVTMRDIHIIKVGGTSASSYIKIDHGFDIDLENISTSNTTGNGITVVDSNSVRLDHVAIGGHASNAGTGLHVTRSSVFAYAPTFELFNQGFYVTTTANVPSQLLISGGYFEGNHSVNGVFDGVVGSTVIDPVVFGDNDAHLGTTVGFEFKNGAHHNVIIGGAIGGLADNGFTPTLKSDATSYMNRAIGTLYQTSAGTLPDAGVVIDESIPTKTVTYSASMTLDVTTGKWFFITVTNNTAFTINAPTNVSARGTMIYITIKNAIGGGGTIGTITQNAVFHTSATLDSRKPADTKNRTFAFLYDGTNWLEQSSGADVAN